MPGEMDIKVECPFGMACIVRMIWATDFDTHVGVPGQDGTRHTSLDRVLEGNAYIERKRKEAKDKLAEHREKMRKRAEQAAANPPPHMFSPVGPGRNHERRQEEARRDAKGAAGDLGEDLGESATDHLLSRSSGAGASGTGRSFLDEIPAPGGGGGSDWLDKLDCGTTILIFVIAGVLSGGLGLHTWMSLFTLIA